MTNTPPPSPTPTSRGIWISGLLLGALVGLVPWAIAQFIPRETADSETPTETANNNNAVQSFSTPTTPGTPVLQGPGGTQAPNSTGPGGVQSPNSATTPGTTQTANPQTQTQTQPVYQPSGGATQIPGNRRVTQSPRPVQRQATNRPAPTSGSGARNTGTGSNRQPIRGLW